MHLQGTSIFIEYIATYAFQFHKHQLGWASSSKRLPPKKYILILENPPFQSIPLFMV